MAAISNVRARVLYRLSKSPAVKAVTEAFGRGMNRVLIPMGKQYSTGLTFKMATLRCSTDLNEIKGANVFLTTCSKARAKKAFEAARTDGMIQSLFMLEMKGFKDPELMCRLMQRNKLTHDNMLVLITGVLGLIEMYGKFINIDPQQVFTALSLDLLQEQKKGLTPFETINCAEMTIEIGLMRDLQHHIWAMADGASQMIRSGKYDPQRIVDNLYHITSASSFVNERLYRMMELKRIGAVL